MDGRGIKNNPAAVLFFALLLAAQGLFAQVPQQKTGDTIVAKIQTAIECGLISYKLTEPQEIKTILGRPLRENQRRDGGMDILEMDYAGLRFTFGEYRRDSQAVFTLLRLTVHNQSVDIGQNSKLVLRSNDDLRKLNRTEGLQNVSLRKVDLSEEWPLLESLPFDSQTEWPGADRLPAGAVVNPTRFIQRVKESAQKKRY